MDVPYYPINRRPNAKGSAVVAHDEITANATSAEIDCRGYNSIIIHWESDKTNKTWTIQILGSATSGGSFVEWITSAGVSNLYTTDISGFFVVQGVPDFIKVVATEVDDGATVS